MEGENLPELLSALWKRGETSVNPKTDRKSQLEQLKAFTKQEVGKLLVEILVRFGNLYPKLKEVEEEANRMLDSLMEK